MTLIFILQKIRSLQWGIKSTVGGSVAAPSGIAIPYQTPKG
jgi:hypothetical protein